MQASLERLRERREKGGEGGFTLIELLIVIVILGILAAIVVFAVQNLTSQSAKASCGSDFKTVETAFETYKAQVGHYPALGTATVAGDNWADTPSATHNAGAKPSTFVDGMEAIYDSQPAVDGSSAGPWLKDIPSNGNLYRIGIASSADGSADVIVVKNLSTSSISPTGATMSAPDANNVVTVTAPAGAVNGSCSGVSL